MSAAHDNRTGRFLLLILAVAQVGATIGIQILGNNTPGNRSVHTLLSPAPYAFAIWGVIYLLCIAHAAAVLRFGTAAADGVGLIAALAVLYTAAAAWSVAFVTGNSWLTFAVLMVMAAAAIRAVQVASGPHRREAPVWLVRLERLSVQLYAGWAMVAVFVNFAVAAAEHGLADAGVMPWQWALLVIALLVLLAVQWRAQGAPGVALAAVWALVALIVAVWDRSGLMAVTCVVGIVAVCAMAWWRGARARDRPTDQNVT